MYVGLVLAVPYGQLIVKGDRFDTCAQLARLDGHRRRHLRNASNDLMPERASFFSPKASSSSPRSANPFIEKLVLSWMHELRQDLQNYADGVVPGQSKASRVVEDSY